MLPLVFGAITLPAQYLIEGQIENYVNFIFSNHDTIQINNVSFSPNNKRNEKLKQHISTYDTYLQEFYGTENELRQNLLTSKFQAYCQEQISASPDGLGNMFCLYRSKFSYTQETAIFQKVYDELQSPHTKSNYHSSLGKLINIHEFDSLNTMANWSLWLLLLSIGINIILVWNLIKNRKGSKQVLPNLDQLTSKEREVLDLITANKSNKDISSMMFVSDATVKTHINNIYRKLNVNSRKQVIELYKSQKSTPV